MTVAGQPILSLQDALRQPLAAYEDVAEHTDTSLTTVLVKVMIDYKRGRTRQAHARYVACIRELGLDPNQALLDQRVRLRDVHAQLFPLEMLFTITGIGLPPASTLEDYFDVLDLLGPDDRVLHGALYNIMLPLVLRRGDHAIARQLATLAIQEYEAGDAPYLIGYIHYHTAFIDIADGDYAAADASINEAETFFRKVPQTFNEIAHCDVAKAWLDLEHRNHSPDTDWLEQIKPMILSGELWTESFLTLAAVLFRTYLRTRQDKILEVHAELETAMRVRRMTALLPAMQLLRDEFFGLGDAVPPDRPATGLEPLHLLLLQPTIQSAALNEPLAADRSALPRLKVLQQIKTGHHAMQRRQFAQAAEHMWPAIQSIESHAFLGLLATERPKIEAFLAECRARRRFVEQARSVRTTLLPKVLHPTQSVDTPGDLTQTEFAVLLRLPGSTSNKALADIERLS
ncbi:MAG: hypothetical protein AAF709_19000, partial [Pseudomonadota bacterium]